MTAVAIAGWVLALALGAWLLTLRARLEAVACADHELRGPVAALALAAAALARAPGTRERGIALEGQVDRLRAALTDLAAARHGAVRLRALGAEPAPLPLEEAVRAAAAGWAPVAEALGRRLHLDWRAGASAAEIDRGRLAQSLGNILSNALEHGGGDVGVTARRSGSAVRIEVRDSGSGPPRGHGSRRGRGGRRLRGRGLAIAGRAAREAGGSLVLRRDADGTRAALELPTAS